MIEITRISEVILELILVQKSDFAEGLWLLVLKTNQALPDLEVSHNNCLNHTALAGDKLFKFLTYQLVGRVVAYHGNDG